MPGIETSTGGVTYGTGEFYNYILNNLFLPAMADTVIYPNALLKRLPRDSTRVEGKNVVFPIHYDDANGVSALGADGLLPEADSEKYAQYSFGVRHIYVRMRFDGITKDASRTQLASWLKVVESEAKAKSLILARARQRMYHQDGSGRLAEVAAASAGAVLGAALTVRLNQDIESIATCVTPATRWFKVGQIIAVFTAAGAFRGSAQVTGITSATVIALGTITTNGNLTTGDFVVTGSQLSVTLATKDSGFKNEPMGIGGILSDANPADGTAVGFQGVDATLAANAWHRINLLTGNNVLRPLTFELLDQGWTTTIENADTVPTLLLASFPIWRKYGALCIIDRRWSGETKTFDGGYQGLEYNMVPMLADRDMYNNRIAMLDETDLRLYVMADPQWMDMDGSIYHRLTDKDAYQATMYCRETLGTDTRDHHTLITDIQE
jgi:hypothetical protein